MRRAVEIAERIFARINRAAFESKWPAVCDPSGERWTQFSAQVFTHIQVSDTRAATEPFQYAADRKVSAQGPNIDRNCSRSLENIENHMSANAMRTLDNRLRVHNVGAAKENLRNRYEQRGFIDGS